MSGGDLLGALPEDLVQHVLSFLPSRDAVKSAVLSRRWRYLWRSTPAIIVHGSGDDFRLFVNTLLIYRDGASPLRSFEIDADLLINEDSEDGAYDSYDPREVDPHVDVRCALAHGTLRRVRNVDASAAATAFRLPAPDDDAPPLGRTLRQPPRFLLLPGASPPQPQCLPLGGLLVSLDIPIHRNRDGRTPTRISTPSLRYLQLSDNYEGLWGSAPSSLDIMPCLASTSIQLTGSTQIHSGDHASRSLLLHGLSEATSLELIASTTDGRTIFLKDLAWFPIFTKLKTLVLNEWCVYDDVTALECLLRHTPRLESLILQFYLKNRPTLKVETERSHNTSEQSILTFEHLKTVEIKNCPYYYYERVVETRVDEILKLFSDWGIPSNKICINYKET